MAWLFTDIHGYEYISADKPKRMGHRKSDDFNIYFEEVFNAEGEPVGVMGLDIEPLENVRVPGTFSDLTYWSYHGPAIELPKGTIKKIIGVELTWEHGAIEIE